MIWKVQSTNTKGASFKIIQYKKVIKIIQASETPITTIEQATLLLKQTGMKNPKRTIEKINEILETGSLSAAELDPRVLNAIKIFNNIYGIGPSKLRTLLSAEIYTLDELRENIHLLNAKQRIGLSHYEDLQLRIPREEIDIYKTIFENTFYDIDWSINGSYRRGALDSGDIDVLVSHPVRQDLIEYSVENLRKLGIIVEILAKGKTKCMALVHITPDYPVRHIDIIVTEPKSYPFAVLYFTGSAGFNIKMRQHALQKGYSMSEYGISTKGVKDFVTPEEVREKIGKDDFETERDIFDFLDYPYVSPLHRKGFTLE